MRFAFLFLVAVAGLRADPLVEHNVLFHDTGSMRPLFREGDSLRVSPTPMKAVKVGDVIEIQTFRFGNYSHEVIAVHDLGEGRIYFITKGISNRARDVIRVTAAEYRGTIDRSPFLSRLKQ